MVIELVKEYSKLGEVSYYVELDGSYQTGTARSSLMDAQEVYQALKQFHTQARKEILIREEI
jgi:hypothetical protein